MIAMNTTNLETKIHETIGSWQHEQTTVSTRNQSDRNDSDDYIVSIDNGF